MMSVERVAIFWVVNASSGEKSCLHFSIPTGSRAGGEGGVTHSLNGRIMIEEIALNFNKNIFPKENSIKVKITSKVQNF